MTSRQIRFLLWASMILRCHSSIFDHRCWWCEVMILVCCWSVKYRALWPRLDTERGEVDRMSQGRRETTTSDKTQQSTTQAVRDESSGLELAQIATKERDCGNRWSNYKRIGAMADEIGHFPLNYTKLGITRRKLALSTYFFLLTFHKYKSD